MTNKVMPIQADAANSIRTIMLLDPTTVKELEYLDNCFKKILKIKASRNVIIRTAVQHYALQFKDSFGKDVETVTDEVLTKKASTIWKQKVNVMVAAGKRPENYMEPEEC